MSATEALQESTSLAETAPGAGLPPATAYSNPALLGLLGFILATFMANFGAVKWISTDVALWVGVVIGGLGQIIAGLLHFRLRDNFAFLVFLAFGFFWVTTPLFRIADQTHFFQVATSSVAAWLFLWAGISTLFLVGSLYVNRTFPIVFAFLIPGLILQGFGTLSSSSGLNQSGGYLLIACTVPACYALVVVFLNGVTGHERLTLGPPVLAP